MLEKKLSPSLKFLIWSICSIPLLKIACAVFGIKISLYLVPFLISSLNIILKKTDSKNYKWILGLNLVILAFLVKTIFLDSVPLDSVTIKYMGSYVVIPNLILALWYEDRKQMEAFKSKWISNVLAVSLILSLLMLVSLAISFTNGDGSDFRLLDLINWDTFMRKDQEVRNNFIASMNILWKIGLSAELCFLNSGPQAIIFHFLSVFMAIAFLDLKKIKPWMSISLLLSLFVIIAINSRSMILTLVAAITYKFLSKKVSFRWLKAGLVLSFIFPFLLLFLPKQFLNGRMTQFSILLDDLSLLGNGVGSSAWKLNTLKSPYYTFDNIHFEWIHNLGVASYLLMITWVVTSLLKSQNKEIGYFVILITIFHSLNFNLFDPYFFSLWSIYLCLSIRSEYKEEPERAAVLKPIENEVSFTSL